MSFRGRGALRAQTGAPPGRGMRGRGMADGEFVPVPKERRGETLRRIAAFFNPYRLPVAVVLVAILTTSVLGLVNPYLLKVLTDEVIIGHDYQNLGLYVALMIVIPIVSGLIGVGQTYLNNVIGQSVMRDLRSALYSHLQAMPLRFFTETRTGEIQSRLANDVGGIQGVVTDTAASITSNVAVAASTIIAMTLLDWRLTLLSLGMLPFFILLTYPRRQDPARRQHRNAADARRDVGCDRGDAQRQRDPAHEDVRPAGVGEPALRVHQRAPRRPPDPAGDGGQLVLHDHRHHLQHHAGLRVRPGGLRWGRSGDPSAPTAGTIVAFTTLQSRLFFPMGQLLNVQVEIQGSLALFDRIFEYLDMEPEIARPTGCSGAGSDARRGPRRLPRRVVPLPDDARARGGRCGRPWPAPMEPTAAAGAGSVAEERAAVIGEVIAETEPSAEPVDVAVADLEARPDAIDERSMEPLAIPIASDEARAEPRPGVRTRRDRLRRRAGACWWLSSARRAPARRPRPT